MADLIELVRRTDSSYCGLRVDQVASKLFDDYSRGRLQQWIHSGDLTVDGRGVQPKFRMAGGETLRLRVALAPSEAARGEDIPFDIVHQDEDLVVINKAAGMVVHPAPAHNSGTLLNALLHFDENLASLPRAGIVHRLDKDTSGVMVVARSLRAHHSLVRQLQDRSMKRVYEAVVYGKLSAQSRLDAPIGRHPRDRKKMAVVASGKHAVSHFRLLRCFGDDPFQVSHIEVSLETGRTHQIRVHMTHLGHPLVGDPVYGRKSTVSKKWPQPARSCLNEFSRQALHARSLTLQHPGSKSTMRFGSELPRDMLRLLETLGDTAPGNCRIE